MSNSNMSFLIEDFMQFVSGKMTTFSQGDETKIKSEQFSEFGLMGFILFSICLLFSNMAETNWVSLQFDKHTTTE